MPYTPHYATIHLHSEGAANPTSIKGWRLDIIDGTPGTYSLRCSFGKATPKTKGAPTFLTGSQTRMSVENQPFDRVAEEFIRLTVNELKPQGAGKNDYEVISKNIEDDLWEAIRSQSPRLGGASTRPKSVKNDLFKQLELLAAPNLPHKLPILLDGPPGCGKTHNIREFGMKGGFNKYVEVGGSSSMEAIDFLGGMWPIGNGKTVWMDGPVTNAFREAAAGKKVCLGIDELLRIPRRERSTFLNALTPHNGHYVLRTGRPMNIDLQAGTCTTELLTAPVGNLSIIATTNSGSNYPDVEGEDPAGRERWLILHVTPKPGFIEELVTERLTKYNLPPTLAQDFMAVQKAVEKVAEDNFCEKRLSPRMVLQAVDVFATTTQPSRRDKRGVADACKLFIPGLTGRTPEGDVIPEQQESLNKAITASLGI